MATINFSITGTGNGIGPWSGTIEAPNFSDVVSATVPLSITTQADSLSIPYGPVTFSPNSIVSFPDLDGNGNEYVSWRTIFGETQYPFSGWSLDVWSTQFYNAVISGSTWNDLISTTGGFVLTPNKYTLVYKYDGPDGPYAHLYGQSGILVFS